MDTPAYIPAFYLLAMSVARDQLQEVFDSLTNVVETLSIKDEDADALSKAAEFVQQAINKISEVMPTEP